MGTLILSIILLSQIPTASEPPETKELPSFNGITVCTESFIINKRYSAEVVELVRENFETTPELRQNLNKQLSDITNKEWKNINQKYRFLTISIKDSYSYIVGLSYKGQYDIIFHDGSLEFKK